MNSDLLYQIALTLIPNIGPVQAKILLQHLNVRELFNIKKNELEKIEGIGKVRARSILSFNNFQEAEDEIIFIEKHKIKPLFITDKEYPQRLLNCYDSPTLLYYKGEADLNASKVITVIGTRSHTDYGKNSTELLISELAPLHVLLISGLAFGIDAIAHKAALKNNLPTVGIAAHGLQQIYPSQHSTLAREMIKNGGGILSEFRSTVKPDKHNFPIRNRIVAGMSDATIVVETGISGGSMITAELANGYHKDVFALPGKISDYKSAGCNHLIKLNKAILLTCAEDLKQAMGWEEKKPAYKKQRELFIELSVNEKIIVDILKENALVHIDEINAKCTLSSSAIAAAILTLELQNLVVSLPGKLYRLA